MKLLTEAVVRRCFVKKVFLEILENSQVFSCEFCKISKNNFFYRTPLVAASGFIREYPYVKHIHDFYTLQLSQKTQFQNK